MIIMRGRRRRFVLIGWLIKLVVLVGFLSLVGQTKFLCCGYLLLLLDITYTQPHDTFLHALLHTNLVHDIPGHILNGRIYGI